MYSDLVQDDGRKSAEKDVSEAREGSVASRNSRAQNLGLGYGFPRRCLPTKSAPVATGDDSQWGKEVIAFTTRRALDPKNLVCSLQLDETIHLCFDNGNVGFFCSSGSYFSDESTMVKRQPLRPLAPLPSGGRSV